MKMMVTSVPEIRTIARVLDVASLEHGAITAQQGRTDVEI
jgi:hypothetical protein